MEIRELFDLSESDKQLSVQTILDIFDLDVVKEQYYNKWLIVRNDELVDDFMDSYNVVNTEDFIFQEYAVYFQEDAHNTRVVISHDYINDEGEKDAEMYHFFVRRFGLVLTKVLIFYQAHNKYSQTLSLLTPKDELSIRTATTWFNRISDLIFAVDRMYKLDSHISEIVASSQLLNLNLLEQEPIQKSIYFGGIAYRVVSLKEGFTYLKGIKSVSDDTVDLFTVSNLFFDSIEEDTYFLVVDDSVEIDEIELIDFIEEYDIFVLGYIFLKDLIVTNSLFCEDLSFSPSLIVKGNLTVKNAYFSGNTHYIGGSVYGDLIYAKHSLGELHINGYLDTSCIIAHDMPCYIRSIQTKAIISNDTVYGIDQIINAQGDIIQVLNIYPTTFKVRDVIIDDIKVLDESNDGFPHDHDIVDSFNEGKSVVNINFAKVYAHFEETIAQRFNTIFNELIDGKGQANLKIDDGFMGYYFYATFFNDGKKYREIGRRNKVGNYQARVIHDVDSNTYIALLEYYKDNGLVVDTVFQSELTDRYNSTYAVFYAFERAEEVFTKR